jgi:hypothetical protein
VKYLVRGYKCCCVVWTRTWFGVGVLAIGFIYDAIANLKQNKRTDNLGCKPLSSYKISIARLQNDMYGNLWMNIALRCYRNRFVSAFCANLLWVNSNGKKAKWLLLLGWSHYWTDIDCYLQLSYILLVNWNIIILFCNIKLGFDFNYFQLNFIMINHVC